MEQSEEIQEQVRKLVDAGQLEFVYAVVIKQFSVCLHIHVLLEGGRDLMFLVVIRTTCISFMEMTSV